MRSRLFSKKSSLRSACDAAPIGIPKGKALRRRVWEAEPPNVPSPSRPYCRFSISAATFSLSASR